MVMQRMERFISYWFRGLDGGRPGDPVVIRSITE